VGGVLSFLSSRRNAIVAGSCRAIRPRGRSSSGRKAGLEAEVRDVRFARLAELPFPAHGKPMSILHSGAQRKDRLLAFTKGALDVLLARCSHDVVGEEGRDLTAPRSARFSSPTNSWPGRRCARFQADSFTFSLLEGS